MHELDFLEEINPVEIWPRNGQLKADWKLNKVMHSGKYPVVSR